MKHPLFVFICLAGLLAAAGCGKTGKDFDSSLVTKITNQKTTQQDIRNMYGEPFKVGVENGNPIWIYESNSYKVFGDNASKDLIIVFDKNGVVQSRQYMSSNPSP